MKTQLQGILRLFLTLAFCSTGVALAQTNGFHGGDRIQFYYSFTHPQGYIYRLHREAPGGGFTLVAAGAQIIGIDRPTGLAPGVYRYRLEDTGPNGGWSTLWTATLPDFGGNLILSETYSGLPAVRGSVNIPGGVNLSISSCTNFQLSAAVAGGLTLDNVQGTLTASGAGQLNAVNVLCPTGMVWELTGNLNSVVRDSVFRGLVKVSGPNHIFEGNTFYAGVQMGRSAAIIRDNIFLGPLTFVAPMDGTFGYPVTATIRDNSFLGRVGIVFDDLDGAPRTGWTVGLPIAIGRNYYGDSLGPIVTGDPELEPIIKGWINRFFLGRAGAVVQNGGGEWMVLQPHLASGKRRTDTSVFPEIWCNGLVVVQNAWEHTGRPLWPIQKGPLRAGRETLVSVDVRAWDDNISGVRVYAEVGGQRYDATSGGTVRDITAPAIRGRVKHGNTTFNVIVPPRSGTNVPLRVYLDTSGVQGYASGSGRTNLLVDEVISFAPYRARPLRIMVAPWEIGCPGYPQGAPSAANTVASLNRLIPAQLPYGVGQFEIIQESPGRYVAGYGALFEMFVSTILIDRLLLDLRLFLNEYNARAPAPVDRLVAVVKKGVLGTRQDMEAQGVYNRMIDSRICVVEEETLGGPDAALHELGHSAGMYNGPFNEQYQWLHHPPDGLILKGVTVFSPQPGYPADQTRIRHITTWMEQDTWYDVMGRRSPFFVGPDSMFGFWQGFDSLLPAATQPNKASEVSLTSGGSPSSGGRRLLLRGLVATNDLFIAGTVHAYDVTDESRTPLPPRTSPSNREYELVALGTGGAILTNLIFNLENTHPWQTNALLDGIPWQATFDLPSATVRAELRRRYIANLIWSAATTGAFSCVITQPAAPGPIGDELTLAWTVNQQGDTPIGYRIWMSTDGGATWTPTGPLFYTNRWQVPSDFFRPGASLFFRVKASDGLRTTHAQIGPFTLANRAPTVSILAPRPNDRGLDSIPWELVAQATDIEDGPLNSGQWFSSRDGHLGNGLALPEANLSAGQHTLSFRACDSGGLCATSSVTVMVLTNFPTVDLRLTDDALSVRTPNHDPRLNLEPHLMQGATNYMQLVLRNEGFTNTVANLLLYLQPPGGAETLIASQQKTLAPFASFVLSLPVSPTAPGLYRFRGVVSAVDPPEANPADNERTWFIPCGVGAVHVTIDTPEAIAAGAQWSLDGGPWQNSGVTVSNAPPGVRTIQFKPVSNFRPPPPRVVRVDAGHTYIYRRQYEPYNASLRVTLQPDRAVSEGAQWRVDGGVWRDSGTVASNLPPGDRLLEFKAIPWWSAPSNQTVNLVENQTSVVTAVYAALPRPPDPAILYWPTNGATRVSLSTDLRWYLHPTTTGYRLWFGTDPALGPTTFQGAFAGSQGMFWYQPVLEPDRQYYWRVDPTNTIGVTTGAVWTFRTQGQPPVLLSPRVISGEVGSRVVYRPVWAYAQHSWVEMLPAWLTLGADGLISGWPPSPLEDYFMLAATNENDTTYAYCLLDICAGPVLDWSVATRATTNRLMAVTWGDGTYVAVGENGAVVTSTNGLTWVARSSGRSEHFNGVAYGNGRFVAVGQNGAVIVSTNRGASWSYHASGYGYPFNGIGFGDGLFVAVGFYRNIYTSTNGMTWTQRFSGGSDPLAAVAKSPGTWLAVGGMGFGFPVALTSSNGIAWTAVDPGISQNGFFGVAWNGTRFSAVGIAGRIATTTNGLAWQIHTGFTNRDLHAVASGDERFLAVGVNGLVATSLDGRLWTTQNSATTATLYGACFGNKRWVAVGDAGTIITASYEPDSDADGQPDWAERIAGTNPRDHRSLFGIRSFRLQPNGFVLEWESVSNRLYNVVRSTNLSSGFNHYVFTNIVATPPINTITNTIAPGTGPWLFRLEVK